MDTVLALVAGFLVGALVAGGVAVALARRAVLREEEPPPDEAERAVLEVGAMLAEAVVEAPRLTVGERLTRVDEVRAHGLIGADEHAAARERILADDGA